MILAAAILVQIKRFKFSGRLFVSSEVCNQIFKNPLQCMRGKAIGSPFLWLMYLWGIKANTI